MAGLTIIILNYKVYKGESRHFSSAFPQIDDKRVSGNYILYCERTDVEFTNYSVSNFSGIKFSLGMSSNQKWYRKYFLVLMQSYTHVFACSHEHLTGSIPATNLHADISFQPCFERINFDGINVLR